MNAFRKYLVYFDLLEQFAKPGCALCWLGARAAGLCLQSLWREPPPDPKLQRRVWDALGFCTLHAHQLNATAPRLEIVTLYRGFLERMENELSEWTNSRRHRDPRAPCPVCVSVQQAEDLGVRVMADFIQEPEMAAAYEGSSGFCLRHMIQLCRCLKEPARQRVIAMERARIQRLREELAVAIREHDCGIQAEPWGEEETAPSRAVAKVAGQRAAVDPGRSTR